jgi:hypothetical protein
MEKRLAGRQAAGSEVVATLSRVKKKSNRFGFVNLMSIKPLVLLACVVALMSSGCVSSQRTGKKVVSPYAVASEAVFFNALDLTRPDLVSVRQAVEAQDWPRAKQAWAEHLAARSSPTWIWSRHARPEIVALYDRQFGGLASYTNAADQVLARDFDCLGVRKKLGHQVEWLQGPNEWTHVLSRFGFWEDLGRAYWGTGNPVYAQDFVDLLEDWASENPVLVKISNANGTDGSVWRTLEAGIRSQSWFDAMEFFMDAPEFDAEAKYCLTKSLLEHANYLAGWTKVYRRGNWQVCEAAGLATVGIMLPEFKAAADWRKRGLNFLVAHMQRDVTLDGFHGEFTPGYHTWVMNEFLHVARLCQVNHIETPGLLARHEKMYEVLEKISRPNQTFPPVGDAGTGADSVEDSLGVGALLYQRPDFRYYASVNCSPGWAWLFGSDVCERYAALKPQIPDYTSVLLPAAQYAVMRSGWSPQDKYLLFDCAPWGGAHSHQDQLQVTVFAGRDLIVDAGQCSYDLPVSHELRLSEPHSVVMIDGAEQGEGNPKLLSWQTDVQADFASGILEVGSLTHQRSVLFVKPGYWVVQDKILGIGKHEVTRRFHFPVVSVEQDGSAAQTTFPTGMNIRVQPVDPARLEMRTGLLATSVASVVQSPVAALVSRGILPLTLCTVLLPFGNTNELPHITALPLSQPGESRLRLNFPNGQQDEIVIGAAEQGTLTLEGHTVQARALFVRQGPVANAVVTIPGGIGREK